MNCLMPGTKIGPYEVAAPLGAGGWAKPISCDTPLTPAVGVLAWYCRPSHLKSKMVGCTQTMQALCESLSKAGSNLAV